MSKATAAQLVRNPAWGKDLPEQLEIRKGRLVLKSSGKPATFEGFPEGASVNLVLHDELVRVLDEAKLMRHWGA